MGRRPTRREGPGPAPPLLAGYPVAQAFAGHAAVSVTGRYLHASLAEVAGAVAALTGEAHPLAGGSPRLVGACRRLEVIAAGPMWRR